MKPVHRLRPRHGVLPSPCQAAYLLHKHPTGPMGTTNPRTRLARRSPVHRHGGRALLAAAMGRGDHALEERHCHCALLCVGRLDRDVRCMGEEAGREGAVAVDDVRAPNSGWSCARVGEYPMAHASHIRFADSVFPVFQRHGTVDWDGT